MSTNSSSNCSSNPSSNAFTYSSSNSTNMSSMTMTRRMMNNIWMSCFPSVRNLHDGATIVCIGSVLNILNPTIRESNLVLAHNISVLITGPVLTEVCVILVIMHSIFKCKWVRLFMIISTMDWATVYNMTSSMAYSNSSTVS